MSAITPADEQADERLRLLALADLLARAALHSTTAADHDTSRAIEHGLVLLTDDYLSDLARRLALTP